MRLSAAIDASMKMINARISPGNDNEATCERPDSTAAIFLTAVDVADDVDVRLGRVQSRGDGLRSRRGWAATVYW